MPNWGEFGKNLKCRFSKELNNSTFQRGWEGMAGVLNNRSETAALRCIGLMNLLALLGEMLKQCSPDFDLLQIQSAECCQLAIVAAIFEIGKRPRKWLIASL